MDEDERIDAFVEQFNTTDKYPARLFFDWHHRLTGSCEMGRNAFVRNHGIDVDNSEYTVSEFIWLAIIIAALVVFNIVMFAITRAYHEANRTLAYALVELVQTAQKKTAEQTERAERDKNEN